MGRAQPRSEKGAVEFVLDPTSGNTVGDPLRVYSYDPRRARGGRRRW